MNIFVRKFNLCKPNNTKIYFYSSLIASMTMGTCGAMSMNLCRILNNRKNIYIDDIAETAILGCIGGAVGFAGIIMWPYTVIWPYFTVGTMLVSPFMICVYKKLKI